MAITMGCENETVQSCVADRAQMLTNAERHIEKLTYELKELKAGNELYAKENDYLKEMLRRLVGV